MVEATRAGSLSGASATKHTPFGNFVDEFGATWSARRVFPIPPGPVKVSKRTSVPRRSLRTAATSWARPISSPDDDRKFGEGGYVVAAAPAPG